MSNKEIWKQIKNYPDYFISNRGRVMSFRCGSPQILKPTIDRYHRVELCKDGSSERCYVHVLILEAFVSSRPEGFVGNHEDGIKLNDDLKNLEWITKSEDARHAYRLGLNHGPSGIIREGEGTSNAKLKNNDVRQIKKMLFQGSSRKDIAEVFKVHPTTISDISLGYSWTHIFYP